MYHRDIACKRGGAVGCNERLLALLPFVSQTAALQEEKPLSQTLIHVQPNPELLSPLSPRSQSLSLSAPHLLLPLASPAVLRCYTLFQNAINLSFPNLRFIKSSPGGRNNKVPLYSPNKTQKEAVRNMNFRLWLEIIHASFSDKKQKRSCVSTLAEKQLFVLVYAFQ